MTNETRYSSLELYDLLRDFKETHPCKDIPDE